MTILPSYLHLVCEEMWHCLKAPASTLLPLLGHKHSSCNLSAGPMRPAQALQQLQEADRGKEATIKALEKAKRIKDKQLKAAQQSLDQATEAFAEAVRHSTQLSQLVSHNLSCLALACEVQGSVAMSTVSVRACLLAKSSLLAMSDIWQLGSAQKRAGSRSSLSSAVTSSLTSRSNPTSTS